MTERRIRIKDDGIEVNVEGRIYHPTAVAINGGQILVRLDRQGLVSRPTRSSTWTSIRRW